MTINEWKEDFKSFIDELQMPKDDYKGIMAYIDEISLLDNLPKEQEFEEDETESSVRQEDVGTIMNLIEKALRKTNYQTVGYDNTCIWLQVFIDRR